MWLNKIYIGFSILSWDHPLDRMKPEIVRVFAIFILYHIFAVTHHFKAVKSCIDSWDVN